MKVVITGHMNGLGLTLSTKFAQKGYTISGYDLTNNKDITKEDTINELITDCTDADIFVNNAHANQSFLLTQVFKLWEGKDKTIINVSSAITYLISINLPESLNGYISDKKNLDTTVNLLRAKSDLPHIMNIRPSWFESQLISEFNTKKINPDDIADLISILYDMRYTLKTSDIVLEK
jgi:NADP-dependent 3-hydroxy acid dehydrogenase YdfG